MIEGAGGDDAAKLLFITFVIVIFTFVPFAFAEELGVQIIGSKTSAMDTMDLDDMQLEKSYEIYGYARVKPKSFAMVDYFAQYEKGKAGEDGDDFTNYPDNEEHVNHVYLTDLSGGSRKKYYATQMSWKDSGVNADFAWFILDVVNMQKKPLEFANEATVKVIWNDDYEFAG